MQFSTLAQLGQASTFKFKTAHIISVSENGRLLEIELPKKEETFLLEIDEQKTILENKKGKLVDKDDFWVGTQIKAEGYLGMNKRYIANKLVLLTNIQDWKVKAKGILEDVNGKQAIVDGKIVQLVEGGGIKGKKDLKGMSYKDFSKIKLGNYIEIKGTRKKDGVIYVKSGKTWSNKLSNTDKRVRGMISKNYSGEDISHRKSIPKINNELASLGLPSSGLYKGHIEIGGLQLKLVEDYRVQAYVNKVGRKLIPEYQKKMSDKNDNKIHFRFYVVDNPVFNAFAFPDGSIFVNTGLLATIKNEAQLAAVLGHEIAHVTHEHGAKRVKKTTTTQLAVAGLLAAIELVNDNKLSPETKSAIGLVANVGSTSFLSFFGRKHEEQSDRVGLYYMQKAGYDPREAPAVWKQLADITTNKKVMQRIGENLEMMAIAVGDINGKNLLKNLNQPAMKVLVEKAFTPLYSSHPKAKKRYKNLNKAIAYSFQDLDYSTVSKGDERYNKFVYQLYKSMVQP